MQRYEMYSYDIFEYDIYYATVISALCGIIMYIMVNAYVRISMSMLYMWSSSELPGRIYHYLYYRMNTLYFAQ